MLPELSKLSEIIIEGDASDHRYWPVRFVYNFSVDVNMIGQASLNFYMTYIQQNFHNLYKLDT